MRLRPQDVADQHFWINSSVPGHITKFSTTAIGAATGKFQLLGRYYTGPKKGRGFYQSRDAQCGNANDPSRVSVNTQGVAFVLNRSLGSVVAIAGLSDMCKGMNTSAKEVGDLKPWVDGASTDDCVLWYKSLTTALLTPATMFSAIAAQDAYGTDGELKHYVWVGDAARNLWKIDGTSGEVLLQTKSPVGNGNFTVDRAGQLWIASNDVYVARINTLLDPASPDWSKAACVGEGGDNDNPERCPKQLLTLPNASAAANTVASFSVTIDIDQNVWIGTYGVGGGSTGGVYRYQRDKTAGLLANQAGGRWAFAAVGNVYGIATDKLGFVYGAGYSAGVRVIARASFPSIAESDATIVTGTQASNVYGLAGDFQDKMWAIGVGDAPPAENKGNCAPTGSGGEYTAVNDYATVLKHDMVAPSTEADVLRVKDNVYTKFSTALIDGTNATGSVLTYPDSQGDMSGIQTRLALGNQARYKIVLEGCDPNLGATRWNKLFWDGSTPQDAKFVWYGRSANTKEALAAAPLKTIAESPPSSGGKAGVDLAEAIDKKQMGRYLEIQVDLSGDVYADTSPLLRGFEATYDCFVVAQ